MIYLVLAPPIVSVVLGTVLHYTTTLTQSTTSFIIGWVILSVMCWYWRSTGLLTMVHRISLSTHNYNIVRMIVQCILVISWLVFSVLLGSTTLPPLLP